MLQIVPRPRGVVGVNLPPQGEVHGRVAKPPDNFSLYRRTVLHIVQNAREWATQGHKQASWKGRGCCRVPFRVVTAEVPFQASAATPRGHTTPFGSGGRAGAFGSAPDSLASLRGQSLAYGPVIRFQ